MARVIIWPAEEVASKFLVTGTPEAVQEWDQAAGGFSDRQLMVDGKPVWRVGALMKQGFNGELAPLELRFAKAVAPKLKPNPELLALLGESDAPAAASAPGSRFEGVQK